MEDDQVRLIKLITADIDDFARQFTYRRPLGEGADGIVREYQHRRTSILIAIKRPHSGHPEAHSAIHREARALMRLQGHGRHDNIAHMLAYRPQFGESLVPALFSMSAHYGDLHSYREMWRDQERKAGRPHGVHEMGMWKLFRDLALALNWMHDKCGAVHRDVKPANVLVYRPWQWKGRGIPTVPLFKLCDFSRTEPWPALDGKGGGWAGTIDYAPPLRERSKNQPSTPGGDMWTLGATIQDFATGVSPIQSRKMVAAILDKFGQPNLRVHGQNSRWELPEWRYAFSAAYRPLNVSASELLHTYDEDRPVSRSYVPFSGELQGWYEMLFDKPSTRVTSAQLVANMVPLADRRLDKYLAAQADWQPFNTLREAPHRHRKEQRAEGGGDKRVPLRAPGHKGNGKPLF